MIDATSPITPAEWVAIGQYGSLDPYRWITNDGP